MQPTYEELFTQVEVLTRLLEEALAENKILKAKVKELKEKNKYQLFE